MKIQNNNNTSYSIYYASPTLKNWALLASYEKGDTLYYNTAKERFALRKKQFWLIALVKKFLYNPIKYSFQGYSSYEDTVYKGLSELISRLNNACIETCEPERVALLAVAKKVQQTVLPLISAELKDDWEPMRAGAIEKLNQDIQTFFFNRELAVLQHLPTPASCSYPSQPASDKPKLPTFVSVQEKNTCKTPIPRSITSKKQSQTDQHSIAAQSEKETTPPVKTPTLPKPEEYRIKELEKGKERFAYLANMGLVRRYQSNMESLRDGINQYEQIAKNFASASSIAEHLPKADSSPKTAMPPPPPPPIRRENRNTQEVLLDQAVEKYRDYLKTREAYATLCKEMAAILFPGQDEVAIAGEDLPRYIAQYQAQAEEKIAEIEKENRCLKEDKPKKAQAENDPFSQLDRASQKQARKLKHLTNYLSKTKKNIERQKRLFAQRQKSLYTKRKELNALLKKPFACETKREEAFKRLSEESTIIENDVAERRAAIKKSSDLLTKTKNSLIHALEIKDPKLKTKALIEHAQKKLQSFLN